MTDLIVFNLETNTVVESYYVTFNETAPCPRDVFECIGEKNGGEYLCRWETTGLRR
jgi:hypothetical protein